MQAEINFLGQGFKEYSITDRQTDRQTDDITTPHSLVVIVVRKNNYTFGLPIDSRCFNAR